MDQERIDEGIASQESDAAARQQARDSLFMQGTVYLDGGADFPIRIRNLSSGGLMAETTVAVTEGQKLSVDVKNVGKVAGHVAWTAPGRFGIAFSIAIDPQAARRKASTESSIAPAFAAIGKAERARLRSR